MIKKRRQTIIVIALVLIVGAAGAVFRRHQLEQADIERVRLDQQKAEWADELRVIAEENKEIERANPSRKIPLPAMQRAENQVHHHSH